MSSSNSKIEINGASSGYDSRLQNEITTALLQNGGVARIQRVLKQRLDETGWSQDLRDYTERLFRSGEVSSYDEAMTKIMQLVKKEDASNGNSSAGGAPDLRIPQSAKDGGVDAVRKELESIMEMKK